MQTPVFLTFIQGGMTLPYLMIMHHTGLMGIYLYLFKTKVHAIMT